MFNRHILGKPISWKVIFPGKPISGKPIPGKPITGKPILDQFGVLYGREGAEQAASQFCRMFPGKLDSRETGFPGNWTPENLHPHKTTKDMYALPLLLLLPFCPRRWANVQYSNFIKNISHGIQPPMNPYQAVLYIKKNLHHRSITT